MDFRFHPGDADDVHEIDEPPFRIVVLADLSGRGNRKQCETGSKLARRSVLSVDVDNFDDVLARLQPRLTVAGTQIDFRSLEDFHPSQLYGRLDTFRALRELRARLLDPATFDAAAAELETATINDPAPHQPVPNSPVGEGNLLDTMLEQPSSAATPSAGARRARSEVDELVRKIVAPYLVRVPDADRQQALVKSVDASASAHLRALLHDPALQQLEAAWRSIDLLLRRVTVGQRVRLFVVDVSLDELAADFAAA
ncbi:MAG TPA: type VI secretion system contractile sheath small subunit, partial [Pirellulales bacterium]|nr:type VI secretion system contractile sheath small subunit [Pirellulales bacterium]